MTATQDERPPRRSESRWPLWLGLGATGLLLVIVLFPGLIHRLRAPTPRKRAEVHLDVLAGAIEMYRRDHHGLPRVLEDLHRHDPKVDKPYLERIPGDPWGHPYTYRILDEGKGRFEVGSGGGDGIVGTDDDLVQASRTVPAAAGETSQDHLTWIVVPDLNALHTHLDAAKWAHKAVVVDVWATWDRYAAKVHELLDGDAQLRSAFGQLVRLRIDVTEDPAEALRTELGVPLGNQPYMVFISSAGRVIRDLDVEGYMGERSKEELLRRVDELLRAR